MFRLLKSEEFDRIYPIMKDSFPEDERRSYENQKALLERKDYVIFVLEGEAGEIKAFAALYLLGSVIFLEHLAVGKKYRNDGLGSKFLEFLSCRYSSRICLEVEPAETEIAERRIAFYERNGFLLNAYPYIQPSLGEGRRPVPLKIMTTQGKLTEKEFADTVEAIYSKAYGFKPVKI